MSFLPMLGIPCFSSMKEEMAYEQKGLWLQSSWPIVTETQLPYYLITKKTEIWKQLAPLIKLTADLDNPFLPQADYANTEAS